MLQHNGISAGADALAASPQALSSVVMPTEFTIGPGNLVGGIALPPPPNPAPNPLDDITPVSDAMLADAPEGSWPTWRRTNDSSGFSPLDQINKETVGDLRVAWSWGLPAGPSQTTPLVHDGVVFAHGWNDILQALDAVTGELLWEYRRWLPSGMSPSQKRSFALYGDYVYLPTSDAHLVALDVKTGTRRLGSGGRRHGSRVRSHRRTADCERRRHDRDLRARTGRQLHRRPRCGHGAGAVALQRDSKAGRTRWRFMERDAARRPDRRSLLGGGQLRSGVGVGVLRTGADLRHRSFGGTGQPARNYKLSAFHQRNHRPGSGNG